MRDLRGTSAPVRAGGSERAIGASVIALIVGIVAIYSHRTATWKLPPKEAVTSEELPSPGPLPKLVNSVTQQKSLESSLFSR
jgi:hypothetical protein